MRTISDYVIVRVQSELNDFLGVIKDEHGNDHELVLDPTWRPTHHARISAEVVAVPEYLSGQDHPLYEKYKGCPKPLAYRSHDTIQSQLETLPPKYRATTKIPYICGRHVVEMQTHLGVPVEVIPGDEIYFHYNCLLDPSNFIAREDDGNLLYRIHYAQIFCYVREGEINMVNAYVLVSPVFDGDAEAIEVNGQTIIGKVKNGLITEIGEKPKYLNGVVEYIGKGIGKDVRSVIPGDRIFFRPSSEFRNCILGVDFYIMRHWDLLLCYISEEEKAMTKKLAAEQGVVIEFNEAIPLGFYIMVEPEIQEIAKTTRTHIYDANAPTQDFQKGDLFLLPNVVSQTKKQKTLRFGVGRVILSGELAPDKYTGKRVIYELSPFYQWVSEYKCALIKYSDILGELKEDDVA